MALQYSVAVRNAKLDAVTTAIGNSAVLKLRTGTPPANCAAADSGTVVAILFLPTTWMNAADSGQKTLLGIWTDATADAQGTVGHFRLYASDGTTCHAQGIVTITGGGGDMTLDNPVVESGQTVNITSFTLTAGNA